MLEDPPIRSCYLRTPNCGGVDSEDIGNEVLSMEVLVMNIGCISIISFYGSGL